MVMAPDDPSSPSDSGFEYVLTTSLAVPRCIQKQSASTLAQSGLGLILSREHANSHDANALAIVAKPPSQSSPSPSKKLRLSSSPLRPKDNSLNDDDEHANEKKDKDKLATSSQKEKGVVVGYLPREVAASLAPLADNQVLNLDACEAELQHDRRKNLTLTLKPHKSYTLASPQKQRLNRGVAKAQSAAGSHRGFATTSSGGGGGGGAGRGGGVHAARIKAIAGTAPMLAVARGGNSLLSRDERRALQHIVDMTNDEAALVARILGRGGATFWMPQALASSFSSCRRVSRRPFCRLQAMSYDDVEDVRGAAQGAASRGWLACVDVAADGDHLTVLRAAIDAENDESDDDSNVVIDVDDEMDVKSNSSRALDLGVCELLSTLTTKELAVGLKATGSSSCGGANAAALRDAAFQILRPAMDDRGDGHGDSEAAIIIKRTSLATRFLAATLTETGPLLRVRAEASQSMRRARLLFFHGDINRELDDAMAIRGEGRFAFPRYDVEPRGGLAPPLFANRAAMIAYERAWHVHEAAQKAWEQVEGMRTGGGDDDGGDDGGGGGDDTAGKAADDATPTGIKVALYERVVAITEESHAWLLSDASYPPWLDDASALPPPPSPPRVSDASWGPPPLLSAATPHSASCHRRALALGRLHRYEEERQVLWLLLSRRYVPRRRGEWHERYATILCTHVRPQRRTLALEAIERARDDVATSPAFRFSLERRALRLARQLKLFNNGWRLRGVPASAWRGNVSRLDWKPEECTLRVGRLGTYTSGASPASRADWHADGRGAPGTGGAVAEVGRVEVAALRHLERTLGDGWTGVHCEGGVWRTLYGLLFWDVIYASGIPGAFVHAHQRYPTDYHHGFAFARARRAHASKRLREILHGRASEILREAWRAHAGENGGGLLWTPVRADGDGSGGGTPKKDAPGAGGAPETPSTPSTPALVHAPRAVNDGAIPNSGTAERRWLCGYWSCDALDQFLACTPRRVLASVLCLGLLGDAKWASGAPDLMMWHLKKRRSRAVEVKGPGDTLRVNQIHWLSVLAGHTDLVGDVLERLGGNEAALESDEGSSAVGSDMAVAEAMVARVVDASGKRKSGAS